VTAWVSLDQRRVRISTEVRDAFGLDRREMMAGVDRLLESELPGDWSASVTGSLAVESSLHQQVLRTQRWSFLSTAVVLCVLVCLSFRSLADGLTAMIPTILPNIVILGAMGFVGWQLDIVSAMVGTVVLGLGDDEAVHLLSQYRRGRGSGQSSRAAIRFAVEHVGRASVTTSVALSLGFLALALSSWGIVFRFGLIASAAILVALVVTLVVVPAVIASTRERGHPS
jgi:predicted RND superfamily exporter protein